jgi:hypothetical protein
MTSNTVIKSPHDIRDYTITADTDLPKSFTLEIVPVKNQGSKPTCTAHALSSACEYHHQKQHEYYEKFSTEFIYGMREDGEYIGDGMSIRQGLQILLKYGVPYEKDCPGNHDYEKAMEVVESNLEELKELASPHKISAYFKINTADELKTALMKYGVVIVAMPIYKDAKLVNDVYTVKSDKIRGSHSVFIYGWNEKGWLVQNSWGKLYAWDGRFIIPFDFEFKEMWGIVDDIIEPKLNKPKRNNTLDIIYKIINAIVNAFIKLIYTSQSN